MADKRVFVSRKAIAQRDLGQGDLFPKPPGPGRKRPGDRTAHLDYPVHPVGSAGSVTVLSADSLGPKGDELARAVIQLLPAAVSKLTEWFGISQMPATNCIIVPLSQTNDGTGGAYHYGCDGTDLYCDASFGDDGSRTCALWVAEASEVLQASQGQGWDCGASNGEGLSRFHAEVAFPGVLDDYHTADAWLDGARENWIGATNPSDQNPVSTGCAVLFLFWLRYLGYDPDHITQSPGATLADTWKAIGEPGDAWKAFSVAVQDHWPADTPSGVSTDDPWDGAPPPPPPPNGNGGATITLDQDVSAGTYVLGEAASGGKEQLSPELQQVIQEVQELLAQGATVDQILQFLQALKDLVAAGIRSRKGGKDGTKQHAS